MKTTHQLVIAKPKEMRYATVGDYVKRKGVWKIIVSDMGDPRYAFLIHLHELVELELVKLAGITQKDIDRFDVDWEKRKAKEDPELAAYDEPGVDPDAPYHKQHMFAMQIERMAAEAMGVDWEQYNRVVDSVYEEVKRLKG